MFTQESTFIFNSCQVLLTATCHHLKTFLPEETDYWNTDKILQTCNIENEKYFYFYFFTLV